MTNPGASSTPTRSPIRRPLETMRALWRLVARAERRSIRALYFALVLTAFGAMVDMASLALLRSGIARLSYGAGSERGAVLVLAGFLGAALLATAVRLVSQRQTTAATAAVERDLAIKAFRSLQLQDYSNYVREGASAGFGAFERLNLIFYHALGPLITVVAAAVCSVVIIAALLWLYPLAGLAIGIAVLLFVADAAWRRRKSDSPVLSSLTKARSVLLYESNSAFRDIYLTNGQTRLCDDFAEIESTYREHQSRVIGATQSSRHIVEAVGLAAGLVLLLSAGSLPGGRLALLPLLAVLALTALRLLPQVAGLRTALRMISLHGDVTDDVLELLDRPVAEPLARDANGLSLTRELRLEKIAVTRADRPDTLVGLDLQVPAGARIGIRGASGAGKSTLLDVICGAIRPERGRVMVDGVELGPAAGPAWRNRIGVVSQNPVLLGRTLREAVVFPERPDEADPARFEAAIERAGIPVMVAPFEHGLDTPVGEAVAFLSGGQRQRLALAHALYRARDLLILDEATGQLDARSEAAIVAALRDLLPELTLIVVSHRKALFACCETIYDLAEGKLTLAD